MKKGLISLVVASAVLGACSIAFAGAYGEVEQPEEIPAPAPAPPAPEPEPVKIHRKHIGFMTDNETTRGLRGEIGGFYAAEYHDSGIGDVEAATATAHISYGRENFEVGLFAPLYVWTQQDGIPDDRGSFGDLALWGKFIPFRGDTWSAGLGLITAFPTAGDGLGTDEYTFEPFITGGGLVGPVDLRASLGYIVTTAPDLGLRDLNGDPLETPDDLFDRTDLNVAALYPVNETVVVRGEITHQHWVGTRKDFDPVSVFPGVDVSFALGSVDLVLRPTLGIGIHHAPDWQIGLGIALEAPTIGM